MSFMDNLAANPGGSGVYGQPAPQTDNDVLSVVNKLKDREMTDFQRKANFMSDLSLRQEARQRMMFPPEQTPQGGQNTIIQPDPNQMSGYQKGELDLKQKQLGQDANIDSQKLAQQGKLGQESLDLKTAQEKLNQQKSDQVNAAKGADLQRKIDDSNNKLELANKALEAKTQAGENTLQAHKDLAAATEERHKLEMENQKHEFQTKLDAQQRQFDITSGQHDQVIKNAGNTTQTKTDSTGASITTTTRKGDAADNVNAVGKDGKTYSIPKDKLNDLDSDGTPHWKTTGGGE